MNRKVEELVEWVALRLHTQERTILRIVEETSPCNCPWDGLTEHFKKQYRQSARLILSHPDLALIDRERWLPHCPDFGWGLEASASAQKCYGEAMLAEKFLAVIPLAEALKEATDETDK